MPISGGQGLVALAVWDVPVASIVSPGSIGEVLDDLTAAKIAFIDASILANSVTPYEYGPAALANGATYVPAAKTIVYWAHIEGVVAAANDFAYIAEANRAIEAFTIAQVADFKSINAVMYCDGTGGFSQNTGAASNLHLKGVTIG